MLGPGVHALATRPPEYRDAIRNGCVQDIDSSNAIYDVHPSRQSNEYLLHFLSNRTRPQRSSPALRSVDACFITSRNHHSSLLSRAKPPPKLEHEAFVVRPSSWRTHLVLLRLLRYRHKGTTRKDMRGTRPVQSLDTASLDGHSPSLTSAAIPRPVHHAYATPLTKVTVLDSFFAFLSVHRTRVNAQEL